LWRNPKFKQRPGNGAQIQFSKIAVNVSYHCAKVKKINKSPVRETFSEHGTGGVFTSKIAGPSKFNSCFKRLPPHVIRRKLRWALCEVDERKN